MFKRIISLILTFVFCCSISVCMAEPGYGNNNTNQDNTIVDTINWLSSENYTLSENYVYNVDSGVTVTEFKNNFVNSNNVFVDTATIHTGTKVWYGDSSDKYTVIVKGDVDCNGSVNVSDIVAVSQHLIGTSALSDSSMQFKAADVNSSNTVTVVDLSGIRGITLK